MAYSRLKLACLALALVSIVVAVVMPPCAAQDSAQDYVDLHNAARADVGVDPVSWDDTVAAYAANYAAEGQGICAHQHSGGQYGENLYWGSSASASASAAVDYWVAESEYYDHDTNSCRSGQECRHYTQVVWSSTTSIGCASVDCNNNSEVVIICSYNPPGNIDGESPY
ncbi:hypothetical protein BS78_02G025200 [Paspalum vaginatum]|nr:hypothetical protein BS78_02G025200 [Paspalum vaginatum]